MSRPTLSVVVPTRDTRELTLACLESLAAGGVERVEVVVVDEASADGTSAAVAERFATARLLTAEAPAGFAAAANRGLAVATGELLLLLNSDTEVDPGALAALAAAFAAEPGLGVAGARLRYPDGTPQWSAGREPGSLLLFATASGLPALLGRLPGWRRLRPPSGADVPAGGALRPAGWVTGAALAMRREVWERCGPLDEGYRFYGQDLDLCLAARDAGWKVAVVAGFTVLHHHGATVGGGSSSAPAGGRQRLDLLWPDLVRWAGKRRGPSGSRSAARAIAAGARLRLLGRAAAAPFLPRRRRSEWRRESAAVAAALGAVRKAGTDRATGA